MDRPTWAIATLPQLSEAELAGPRAVALAQKYRDCRLHALYTAPDAFAASHEVESKRGLERTLKRLSNHKAVHLVAYASSGRHDEQPDSSTNEYACLTQQWLGMIVILGPEEGNGPSSVSAIADPFSSMTRIEDGLEQLQDTESGLNIGPQCLRYHLNGVFVDSSARKGGLGLALINTALQKARERAERLRRSFRCTILVDRYNVGALKLYEKAGFVVAGQEAYVQQPRALVMGESHVRERVALCLELREDVTKAQTATWSHV